MFEEMMIKQDQRLFERFRARFPAKFKDTRSDFGEKVMLRDASAQGARFVTSERLFVNDSVTVEVSLPDGKDPLTLKGQVIWAKPRQPNFWDVGLKFHQASLMKMSRLYKLVTD